LQHEVGTITGAWVRPATTIPVAALVRPPFLGPFTPAFIGSVTSAHIRWFAAPYVRRLATPYIGWFATPNVRPFATAIIPTLILVIVPAFFEVATWRVIRSSRLRPIIRRPKVRLHDGPTNDRAVRRGNAGLLCAQNIGPADTASEHTRGCDGITHGEAPLPATMSQQAKQGQPAAS
jgi:hypothetical protein